ncbi:GNAT family N-acetyltransferase [Rouxiella badensis]|uniref:GNAT family N-acetyltransferase n=1 Tax=Rouxiella badensis TaxID=1646377 RepID=UPI000382ECE8|nr:GNAT family N-acetyltransferase [Rouxiella badensis]MCC3704073.1 GNAT family N-acetyltransferase [Rouxiella badensis]MCC3719094.1 GNAT family N-acetyltransferase [Rouxiella badensis]MCC3729148.1 GNAT family N-acetyltransferase [Rouxiella badensis]MCC3733728.1 GNAT family N-acetyltransferase [Rouxiella badensis]MCC3740715.1 GNAT family N-acetyltransferase [Rouxiella badensis]
MPIQIRPYQEADRPFLRTLYLASRKEAFFWLDSSDWKLEDFDRKVIGEKVIVAEQDGKILGFASIHLHENFLHNLFISPDAQGQGVGSHLLGIVEQNFTRTGSLKCLVKNEKAVTFYLSRGWEIISTGDSETGEYYLFHFRIKR